MVAGGSTEIFRCVAGPMLAKCESAFFEFHDSEDGRFVQRGRRNRDGVRHIGAVLNDTGQVLDTSPA